ncbi:hypothetical protein OROMI_033805 [Orobanche minor]
MKMAYPCAAHCLDLMLEDIAKLNEFSISITHGKGITIFVYKHDRLLSAMREKTDGKDLVRAGATRFATAFLTMKFNDVLEKMVVETSVLEKISDKADQYENSRNAFGKQLTVRSRKTKNPLDWWGAFGGLTIELTMFAKRIVGLCCSSSGCERNWSTFEFIQTKKRNRLEHRRLNDLVYIQCNQKIATRFQKRRESGKNFDPLILDDFQWDNKWVNGEVVDPGDDEFWLSVDRALDASEGIESRRNPRRGGSNIVYGRRASGSSRTDALSNLEMEDAPIILDDDVGVKMIMDIGHKLLHIIVVIKNQI